MKYLKKIYKKFLDDYLLRFIVLKCIIELVIIYILIL